MSSVIFTVCIGAMITRLKDCHTRCWIEHYYGSLVSADHISLLSSSVVGVQKMVDTCAEFGVEYAISFNDKKSVC